MLKRADWQALQEAQKGAKPIQLVLSFSPPHGHKRHGSDEEGYCLYCALAPLPLFEQNPEN